MKKLLPILALTAVLVFSVSLAYAAEPGGAQVTSVSNDTDGDVANPGRFQATSGYIHDINLNASMQTFRWAGILGDTTGQIFLNDSSNNSFYKWTGAEGAYVFASTDNAVDWTTLVAADNTTVPAHIESKLTVADDYADTFDRGATALTTDALGAQAAAPTALLESTWGNWLYYDGSDIVVAANVSSGAADYAGGTADYEMLLPEDGTGGDATGTDYYFYVELV